MPPTPVSSPERRFVITRIDNGVEANVIASTPLPANYTTDAGVRPGVAFRLYGPTDGSYWTEDDRVWDSGTDQ